ncbi:MAG TPA: TonB family protein [Alphaproteobacteria bacterium]|nr:TonB family protein [Alphaproteobacteria bacterium]
MPESREGQLSEGRLSPAVPRRVRVLSLTGAVVLHAAMVAVAALYAAPQLPPVLSEIEVVLVEQLAEVMPSEPVEEVRDTRSGVAEVPESTVDIDPLPTADARPEAAPEASSPSESVAQVEPTPKPVAAPPAPLPPPAPRRPTLPPAKAEPRPAAVAEPAAAAFSEPPAVAIVPAPPAAVRRPDADYVGTLLGWLERYKEYPRAARLRRIEGTAVVRLTILADGRLGSLTLARSSGHQVLDEASLDMVRRATPLPRPPAGPVDLDVPIVFAQGAR